MFDPKTRSEAPAPQLSPLESPWRRALGRGRRFLKVHGHKLWWLHSAYALTLGAFVASFAQKGFDHARWLAVTLGSAWLLMILFFRVYGSGAGQSNLEHAPPKAKIRFYVMTYALKNLYQGMLFFLVPFYWKSTTPDAPNVWFVILLAVCAVLSTLDIVFDRVLMRWRSVASLFHGIILFGCLNLVFPALLADTRTLYSLLGAGAVTVVGFWTLHVPVVELRNKLYAALFLGSIAAGTGLVYVARTAIPPVPMHLSRGAVGPVVLEDGRLAMEVTRLHFSVIKQLMAVTDVVIPGGKGDRLLHVWRLNGVPIARMAEELSRVEGPFGTVRLKSSLTASEIPEQRTGSWHVDVETEDGQLVGRVAFVVIE